MSSGPWYYRAARALALKVIPQPEPAVRWIGDYERWSDAVAAAQGYDSGAILDRVVSAARAVRDGEALWERDGVTFDEPEYAWPLVAGLLYAATGKDSLHVVDVGGALASTYRQHAPLLDRIPAVRWTVVEQSAVADAGSREFADEVVRFTDSMQDADLTDADLALFGSSLGYLEHPYEFLAAVADAGTEFVLIDRTPFIADPAESADRIALQVTRLTDGAPDSYPCWVFARRSIEAALGDRYEPVAWWLSDLQPVPDPVHWGCLWRIKN